jgi:general secretion pathway protein K
MRERWQAAKSTLSADQAVPLAPGRRDCRRGSALLAVLWLSLALTAIAFALSRSVRSEFDRAALNVASTRAYFLAQGAIERALLRLAAPGAAPEALAPGQRYLRFAFPTGEVEVEIIGENGKLSLRNAPPEALARLFAACRVEAALAAELAARIAQARQSGFFEDGSSFSGAGASFLQLEELLAIPGMTPEILFGSYREEGGELVRIGGLIHQLTLEPVSTVNLNYASAELLQAAGLPDPMVQAIDQIRRQRPLQAGDPGITELLQAPSDIRLGLGGAATAFTLRATARLEEGRVIRSVSAVAKRGIAGPFPLEITRWYGVTQ